MVLDGADDPLRGRPPLALGVEVAVHAGGDPGRFQQGLPDFTAVINQFKRNKVQVVTGVLAPPDLQNYLQQAAQANYKPKMYIIDKGTGYPEPMNALGKAGYDVLSVNFWSPAYPGRSSFGGSPFIGTPKNLDRICP